MTPNPNYYTIEHEQFRRSMREFVAREITPYVEEWDESESFPRDLYRKAAAMTMQFCADQAVQILGGMGYMCGSRVERIYRDVKVYVIGGGAEEIMKDLAARQMRL